MTEIDDANTLCATLSRQCTQLAHEKAGAARLLLALNEELQNLAVRRLELAAAIAEFDAVLPQNLV